MKVILFGASGIVGQHMRLCVPEGIEPIWCRKTADPLHYGTDLTDAEQRTDLLHMVEPKVVVNLAGHNDVDFVERSPDASWDLNVEVPRLLARWCDQHGAHYLHVSTQAVFDGQHAPYRPVSNYGSLVNAYGNQKQSAEAFVRRSDSWSIARLTFMVGVRPLPTQGRENPVEAFLAGKQPQQVWDRYFSVAFARDAAQSLWEMVQRQESGSIRHIGVPNGFSRFSLMSRFGEVKPVSHAAFQDLAERPLNTQWEGHDCPEDFMEGRCGRVQLDWQERAHLWLGQRARELALFLGMTETVALEKLSGGFFALHAEVAADFRHANPQNDEQLLDWYRETEAYLWELSAYHLDQGFNYAGFQQGIVDRLKSEGKQRVLCLGDGIGDLTLACRRAGLDALYHDLAGSRTAAFAEFRFWAYSAERVPRLLTSAFAPDIGTHDFYAAITANDFLEHLPNVEGWVRAISEVLSPGGLLCAQNAFNCGSGPRGSIPCHLEVNDHYEHDWKGLMEQVGFEQVGDIWWRRR